MTTNKNDNKKVLLLEGVHIDTVGILEKNGFEVERTMESISTEDLIKKLQDVHYLGIRSRSQLTRNILEQAPKLEAIFCFCIGTNQVDVDCAQELGIPVFNSPFSNTRSVAELVLAIIVFLMRGIPQKNHAAHQGAWQKSAENSYEVRRKKLGIIGYGNIGAQLSILASGMGIHVYYYDIANKLPHGNSAKVDTLEELLELSDIVSLHVPETPETENLIDAKAIAKMKNGSYLINYSRGNVVDIDALVASLENGKIAGAAIDVFPNEPKGKNESFESPLRKFDTVILTPHIGGSTMEAQETIGADCADSLIKYAFHGITEGAVNFPQLQIPILKEEHSRVIHIHKNVPGMLQKINQVFYEHGMNIIGEWLQTSPKIGYTILDIEKIETEHSILENLRDIEGTIRAKII